MSSPTSHRLVACHMIGSMTFILINEDNDNINEDKKIQDQSIIDLVIELCEDAE